MPKQKRQELKQRADGRYVCYYHDIPFYGYSSDEALDAREQYKAKEKAGMLLAGGKTLVAEYADSWLPTHRSDVARQTYDQYKTMICDLMKPLKDRYIQDITPDDISRVYAAMRGKSASYITKAKNLIKGIFDSAVSSRLILSNPARDDTVRAPKGSKGTHRAITNEEREIIHRVQHHFRPVVMAMLYSGLRPEEARAINVKRDVDFERKTISVREAVSFDGNHVNIGKGKNDFAVRSVILLPILEKELKGIAGRIAVNRTNGKVMTQSAYKRAWESYLVAFEQELNHFPAGKRWWGRTKEHKKMAAAAANLRAEGKEEKAREYDLPEWKEATILPYDMRHSFCTMCRDAGVDMHVCMKWMGHTDERMIIKIYDHVSDYREKMSAEILKKIGFNGQKDGHKKKYTVKRSKINGFRAQNI